VKKIVLEIDCEPLYCGNCEKRIERFLDKLCCTFDDFVEWDREHKDYKRLPACIRAEVKK